MGTATSFGHQPTNFSPSMFDFSTHISSDSLFDSIQFPTMAAPQLMPPPRQHIRAPLHSQPSQNSPTNAAAVLAGLQNGQTTRVNGLGRGGMVPSQASARPTVHPMLQTQNQFTGRTSPIRAASIQSPLTPLTDHGDENLFADMAFGNPHGSSNHRVVQQVPEDVHWGSDRNFIGNQSFIPSSERETAQSLERQQLKYLEIFHPISSAATTRPSSPQGSGTNSPVGGRNGKMNGQAPSSRDMDVLTKKRRKSDEADEEDDSGPSSSKPAARKRRSRDNLVENGEGSPSTATPGKRRRKSNVNSGSKPPRENLSDEAKVSQVVGSSIWTMFANSASQRRNHIKSEQRRRHVIKDGFENLSEIVPNLKNGGYSKSAVLQMAADWLEELTKGNELLR